MSADTFCCSHCNSALSDAEFGAVLFSQRLTEWEAVLLRRLIKAGGKPVHHELLTQCLYGHRLDPPRHPRRVIYIHVVRLNQKIAHCKYRIVSVNGFGYYLSRMPVRKAVAHGVRSGNHHPDRRETWSPDDIIR